MFRTMLAAGAAITALVSALPAQAQEAAGAVSAPEIEFTQWTLDNGLRVIALPDQGTATVTTSMWYEVGSKHDPQGRSGYSHLFEHILSRKTENMPYNMVNRLTEDVGGTRNASNSDDRTNYRADRCRGVAAAAPAGAARDAGRGRSRPPSCR